MPTSEPNAIRRSCAVSQVRHEGNLRALLKLGLDVNMCTKAGDTPLLRAMMFGHMNCVQTLLTAGATTEMNSDGGALFCRLALDSGESAIIELAQSTPST